MASVKAGTGPVQLFRLHFKLHCRFFDIFHDYACSLVVAATSSAPADVFSAIAATSLTALILHFAFDGQQA
ncbi:hypothetical protein [Peribacillus simplex]|uniref:Uncharacterized protein n=1 Tax=Peribacillus simplex TaxID=1478 RepID=A0A8B5Y1C9_9BACI|nr:hypothetical protein [Peribacillus simplex]MEC1396784.1 hypothetical protein [Peribacillus simplex]MED3908234.1 hypothetical protein [Peribacillus simplex]MED3983368.1 hypothetical protein [Peribacillus simplex]MED4092468.1 hypothetical protein [Peribacillus simplex]TVX82037.1 hypothetical protein FQP34_08925 [Peribacillus simplex]